MLAISEIDPKYSIAAIIHVSDESSHPKFIGTGFFISESGIFVTAKHILPDSYQQREHPIFGYDKYDSKIEIDKDLIYIVQFLGNNKVLQRRVLSMSLNANTDVAVGVAGEHKNPDGNTILTPPLILSGRHAKVGDTLHTYAFPNTKNIGKIIHLNPQRYDGKVVKEYQEGRDRTMLPNPCYETQMQIPAGASGGPAFNLPGSVVGINCTSLYNNEKVSFVSKLDGIENMKVPNGGLDKMITIGKLIQLEKIYIHQWDSTGNDFISGYNI